VTRENVHALTGNSAISAASDAAIDASSHPRTRRRAGSGVARRAPSSSAAVAPNVRMNPASRTSSGRAQMTMAAAAASACHGGLR
jgi:hypothetical protein